MALSTGAAQDRKYNVEKSCILCIIFLVIFALATSCGYYTVTWESDLYIPILNKTDANTLKFRLIFSGVRQGGEDPSGIYEINLTPNDTDIRTIYFAKYVQPSFRTLKREICRDEYSQIQWVMIYF